MDSSVVQIKEMICSSSPEHGRLRSVSHEESSSSDTTDASLQHVISGCKIALTQGRYRWRYDHFLRYLADIASPRAQQPTHSW